MAPFASGRIALQTGLSYHYLEWDRPTPRAEHTVVFLHGFLDFCETWLPVVAHRLADRFHVIAPDLRGHGKSDRIGAGGYYHFLDYLADLHDLIAKLGRQRVSLVGHSMGGAVVSYYAGAYPADIHRVAILDGLGPPVQAQDTTPVRVATWIAAWERAAAQPPRSIPSVEAAAERLQRHDRRLSPEQALALASFGTRENADGTRTFLHDPLHVTPGPLPYSRDIAQSFWRRITAPTLIVFPEESEFQHPADELALRLSAFQHPQIVTLPDCGHMLQRHQPRALADVLYTFLTDNETAG